MDQLTGLPVLPEGYFWRVSHAGPDWALLAGQEPRLAVEIRVKEFRTVARKAGGFFSKWVPVTEEGSRVVLVEECKGTAPVAVVNAARRAVKRLEAHRAAEALVGDYPPKSLAVPGE